jgi:Spy/CpxP family protein refolding chaperone
MQRRRWIRTAAAAAAVVSAVLVAHRAAGQTVKEKLDITRETVENQRRVLVAGSLPLTEGEAKAFWPLYDAYEKERRGLDERANRLVAEFLAAAAALSDAQAKAMTDEALKVDEDRARLRRAWYERMAKAIPPRKLARLYQIDNKLDSVVRADIANQIPLAP